MKIFVKKLEDLVTEDWNQIGIDGVHISDAQANSHPYYTNVVDGYIIIIYP